jgi:hypothetical protein
MSVLEILKIVAAVGTIATGFISLFRPKAVFGFTGLEVSGPRGISEIRSVLGGLFIGLGAAPLILSSAAAYQTLGIGYLAVGVVRLFSILIDKASESSSWISLVVEIVFGIVLVL